MAPGFLDIGDLEGAVGIMGVGAQELPNTRQVSAGYSHTGTDRASKFPRPQRGRRERRGEEEPGCLGFSEPIPLLRTYSIVQPCSISL